MLIPQGMAYALIAGLPPVYGLYASIVPQLVYALLGTSRQLSVAPVAMDSLLVASGVSLLATEGSNAYIRFAILLAFFMGAFQFLLGTLRLGFIANLLSKPVISGFTSAAALTIGLNQLKYLMGIDLVKSNKVYEIIAVAAQKIDQTHLVTLFIGLTGILIIMGLKKLNGKIPGALVAVVVGIASVYFLGLEKAGVNIVQTIPEGLPTFIIPDFSLGQFSELIPLALTISIVAYMESYSVAKSIEAKKRSYKVLPNQELLALGASNVVGSLFQAFPVTGGFSRTAVNYQAGANTPMASIISALLVALTLIFLTPLFYFLPKAILASVIMVAVFGLIDLQSVKSLWKTDRRDLVMLIVTFVGTLTIGIVEGILIGVVLSIAMVLYRSSYPHYAILGKIPGANTFRNIKRFPEAIELEGVLMLRFDAELFFANAHVFREIIDAEILKRKHLKLIIINAEAINALDSSAVIMLKEVHADLFEMNIDLVFAGLKGPVRDIMVKNQMMEQLGEHSFFDSINDALENYDGVKISKSPFGFQYNLN